MNFGLETLISLYAQDKRIDPDSILTQGRVRETEEAMILSNKKVKYEILEENFLVHYKNLGLRIQHEGRKMGLDTRPIACRYGLRILEYGGNPIIKYIYDTPEMAGRIIGFCSEYFGCVPVRWLEFLKDEKFRLVMVGAIGLERCKNLFPEYFDTNTCASLEKVSINTL